MGFWTIIPVKPLRRGKSRLASILSEADRTELNSILLQNTLLVLNEVSEIDHTLVISRDPQALALARRYGARTLLENRDSNLNRALEFATSMIRRPAHRGILILPADLPLLSSLDVVRLLNSAQNPPVISIVPDRHKEGTNALLVSPPGLVRYSFGIGSFQRHCSAVALSGARLEVIESAAMGLDLDTPGDLNLVRDGLMEQLGSLGGSEINLDNDSDKSMLNYKRLCLELIPQQ